MRIDILTLFPTMCEAVLGTSIIGKARKQSKVEIHCHNIRDYTNDRHNRVDAAPYGGGRGMIMSAQPIDACLKAVIKERQTKTKVIYLTPKGRTFTQKNAIELSKTDGFILLCGHYEGVDERVLEKWIDEEISIGDFVLTGGEIAAVAVADAVCRLLPGVLSENICYMDESLFNGLLEYPQYTRPAVWEGRPVPDVLLSGHHLKIAEWRRKKSLEVTLDKRIDLLETIELTTSEKDYLETIVVNRTTK